MSHIKDEGAQVRLDWARRSRTGLAEAVMCQGKTRSQLQEILSLVEAAGEAMLFTRLEAVNAQGLDITRGEFDYDAVSNTAIYRPERVPLKEVPLKDISADLAVVTGGSADIAVAREAIRTLDYYGYSADAVFDVGVAGLWRIQEQQDRLSRKRVIICVAGMDAALPTVLGGLVPGLIVAVPSSIGYGMANEGHTALNALLCSCAQGLVVVNIDNGFGAACAALRSLR